MSERSGAPPALDAPPASTTPDVRSWPFWRKRLARVLVVGGLALAVTQLLPALPTDQFVEVRAPRDVQLTEVQLTYFERAGDEPLAQLLVHPTEPTTRVPHSLRLPSGEYSIHIVARGTTTGGEEKQFEKTRNVALSGQLVKLPLSP